MCSPLKPLFGPPDDEGCYRNLWIGSLVLCIAGFVLLLAGGLMWAVNIPPGPIEEASCTLLGAERKCTDLLDPLCSSWSCVFSYNSTCAGKAVTGTIKRNSMSYNGIGRSWDGARCLESVDAHANGTVSCWHNDACIYLLTSVDELKTRFLGIISAGAAAAVLGPVGLFVSKRLGG